jgi:hypothetical protein
MDFITIPCFVPAIYCKFKDSMRALCLCLAGMPIYFLVAATFIHQSQQKKSAQKRFGFFITGLMAILGPVQDAGKSLKSSGAEPRFQ